MPWALAQRRVHAQQHAGPVAGLRAAGAGVDLHVGVVAVGLAREQRLQLGAAGALLEGLQAGRARPRSEASSPSSSAISANSRASASSRSSACTASTWRRPGAVRSRIRAWASAGPVPQRRVLDPGVQLIELSKRRHPSQRRLLSSSIDCSMSAAAASTSALMVYTFKGVGAGDSALPPKAQPPEQPP